MSIPSVPTVDGDRGISFAQPPGVDELVSGVRRFVDEVVIPAEREVAVDAAPGSELRDRLQAAARAAGVFAPHVPVDLGGLGLSTTEQVPVFEEAGRSLLGPLALNCAAPDEGNMLLLERVASASQKQRYLRPLARGEIRSCFAMTEPSPGAGADPDLLRTTADECSGGWRISGRKWFITGADGAAFAIVMARTHGDRATMFLVDADNPRFRVSRHIPSLDTGFVGGHCEVELDGCEVGPEAVLGEVDQGFRYAQVRLGPARLTHCMRWLGVAGRAHEQAVRYAADRPLFGAVLGDLGMAQAMIADNEIDLSASRALVLQAAWALDRGESARHETSVAKTFVAEAVNRVVDRSLQLSGASGVAHDLPLAKFFREVRPFRIYDGPSEVHRMSIARRAMRRHGTRPHPREDVAR